jgi:hypothetical protein
MDDGSMQRETFAAKIAYACIFAQTVEEATENLVRLITNRDCGLDEGATAWREVLKNYRASPEDLGKLNRFGANFTAAQWREILEQVYTAVLQERR